MKIKHQEIEIPKENPFQNCQLGRKKYAEILTEIVGSYSDGFVLALDNKWGTGKTTFAKMWKQHLENQGFKTIYFNAWVNDFDANPLVAILSELKAISEDKKSNTFKSVLSKGAVIMKNVVPGLAKSLAKKYIDVEEFASALEETAKSATEILKDEIDEYAKKKDGLLDFKSKLEDYITSNNGGKPLIFIIDELDRCRPNYAVEVLEQIKHFFNVNGIVFVLSIDKVQLGNAIKGFYGSDKIDANEYLRRFIDIHYHIPEPNIKAFNKYLFKSYEFSTFFLSEERKIHRELQNDVDAFLKMADMLFESNESSLRQQEKIFAHARIVLKIFPIDYYVIPAFLFFLIYIRDLHKELYHEIKERKILPQAMLYQVRKLFPEVIDKYDLRKYALIEAQILKYYDNYLSENVPQSKIIGENSETHVAQLLVESGFGQDNNQNLLTLLISLDRDNMSHTKLSYWLDKIDLLENISN